MNTGIHNIPMADYLADPCPEASLSSGCAHRLLTRSPLHAWSEHPRLGGRSGSESNASEKGSVAHDMLLGGEGKICVIDPADYRSKPTKDDPDGAIPKGWTNGAIRAARDMARGNGLTPILAAEYGAVIKMAEVARQFLSTTDLAGALDNGKSEQTLIWQEGKTWFRARPDWLTDDGRLMLHYKTTEASANPAPFIRGLLPNMGYDVSLAFYRRGWEALGGSPDTLHVILVQEQSPPYACSLVALSPVMLAIADEKVQRAVDTWEKCMRTNRWPAYSPAIHYAEPTAWQLAEAEAAMQSRGFES